VLFDANTTQIGYTFIAEASMDTDQHVLQKQFDSIFHFTNYGIWILDNQGVVLKVNEAAERLIGITAKEVVGKKIMELERKGVIDHALTPQILSSKSPATRLIHVLKTKRQILSTGIPVFDSQGEIILVVVNEYDITTLNSLKEELEQLKHMAQRYQDELSNINLADLQAHGIVSESMEMRQMLNAALKLSRLDASNILITGESGTGKGLVAQFIHNKSKRKNKPFVQVNCAALPESLLEAELFGYDKGAFTGATKGKVGYFEMAQDGTILLDEIGELPFSVQAKLLKCLEDHQVMHIGGIKPIPITCTIIAATNRDLQARVDEKMFRPDLYHRLNAFVVKVPPLRERPEDIIPLVNYYLDKYNTEYQMSKRISLKGMNLFLEYHFSGNVRELKNILRQLVVMTEDPLLDEAIQEKIQIKPFNRNRQAAYKNIPGESLKKQVEKFEKSVLTRALKQYKNTRMIAYHLKTSQSMIARKLKKYRLSSR
jgi:PAS domain S-box-containing protein/TyrR family helix-turn-helix protein